METREIPRDSWIEFLNGFSRRHEGWLVDVQILGGVGAQTEAHERPLEGVSSDPGGRHIAITLGPAERPAEHLIEKPSHVRVQEEGGADLSLQIESSGGETTLLTFRSPLAPERVDGVAPDETKTPESPRGDKDPRTAASVRDRRGGTMKRVDLSIPEFGFVVATRAALGAGVGLLASQNLCRRTRQRVGLGLLILGALTTAPAAYLLFGRKPSTRSRPAAA
ncbi:MAG TPA: DUF5335 family protein [Thermoanaerobaculia bacterium]